MANTNRPTSKNALSDKDFLLDKEFLLDKDFFDTMDDAAFEKLLRDTVATVQPPSDFSERVMSAIRSESVPTPAPAPKLIRFPLRRIFVGTGVCAAAVLLFAVATVLPGDNTGAVLSRPLQTAAEPIWQTPTAQPLPLPADTADITDPATAAPATPLKVATETPAQSEHPASQAHNTLTTSQAGNISTNNITTNRKTAPDNADKFDNTAISQPTETGSGELVLPRAAYGSQAEGTLATRMVATIEGNKIFAPNITQRNSTVGFQTVDDSNVYFWCVELKDGAEPQVAVVTEIEPGTEAYCPNTTPTCDHTTIVKSPDGMMSAQNAADDDKGIWIALKDGDVYKLTIEGGGNLLLWSNDSARLLFTNSEGQLFVGYPLEKRIYQITDLKVKDICLGSDNKTLLFIANKDGQDALYTCQLL